MFLQEIHKGFIRGSQRVLVKGKGLQALGVYKRCAFLLFLYSSVSPF